MILTHEFGAYRLYGGLGQNKKLRACGFRYGAGRWTARTTDAAVALLRMFPGIVRMDLHTWEALDSWNRSHGSRPLSPGLPLSIEELRKPPQRSTAMYNRKIPVGRAGKI